MTIPAEIVVRFGKRRERNGAECWWCRTGNIITTSTVSAMECAVNHYKKLRGEY